MSGIARPELRLWRDENEDGSLWAGPDMPGTLWGFHSRVGPEHHLVTELSGLARSGTDICMRMETLGIFVFTGILLFVSDIWR